MEKPYIVVGGVTQDVSRWQVRKVEVETKARFYLADMKPLTSWRNSYWDRSEVVAQFATEEEANAFLQAAEAATAAVRAEYDAARILAENAREAAREADKRVREVRQQFIQANAGA